MDCKKVDPSISDIKSPKSSKILLTISIILIVVAAILSIVSAISMGLGFIKSYADNEPLAAAYDVHGNEYFDYMEVPLYDKEGNIYTYEPAWFVIGDYIDQNGKAYDGDNCYLDQEGFFYYDKNKTLKPHETHDGYYTDGENIKIKNILTYDNGDGTSRKEYLIPGEEITLKAPMATMPGYEFAGWKCQGTIYPEGSTITVTEDTTVEAVWTKK